MSEKKEVFKRDTTILSIVVPIDWKHAVKKRAIELDRTVSNYIRHIINNDLKGKVDND